MNNTASIEITADVKAPILVITPSGNICDGAEMLVIDLGNISFRTQRLARTELDNVRENASNNYTSDATSKSKSDRDRALSDELTPTRRHDRNIARRSEISSDSAGDNDSHEHLRPDGMRDISEGDNEEADTGNVTGSQYDIYLSPVPSTSNRMRENLIDSSMKYSSGGSSSSDGNPNLFFSNISNIDGKVATPVRNGTREIEEVKELTQSAAKLLLQEENVINDAVEAHDQSELAKGTDGYDDTFVDANDGIMTRQVPTVGSTVIDGDPDENNRYEFDEFQVIIKDIEVFMTSHTDAIFTRQLSVRDVDISNTEGLIDRFDVSIDVSVSVILYDAKTPRIYLAVEFPEINVRLSDAKLVRLATFANRLSASSKAFLDTHRDGIHKFISAVEGKGKKLINNYHDTSVTPLREFPNIQDNDINIPGSVAHSDSNVSNILGYTLHSDEEDEVFYDANERRFNSDHDAKSTSTGGRSRSNSIILKKDGKSPRPSRSYNTIDTPSNAGSLKDSRLARQYTGGSIGSEASYKSWLSPRSTVRRQARNDAASSDSDDSFASVTEGPGNDALREIELLLYTMKQREVLISKLMSQMRLIESDASPKAKVSYTKLKDEIKVHEVELHQLKVDFLDAKMHYDTNFNIYGGQRASDLELPEAFILDSMYGSKVNDNNVGDTFEEVKRMNIRSNIFRTIPITHAGNPVSTYIEANKKLFHCNISLSVVNVIFSCNGDAILPLIRGDNCKGAKEEALKRYQQKDVLRLRLAGISCRVSVKTWDTKLSLVMRELDIEDVIASSNNLDITNSMSTPVFLISSEPSTSGISLSQERYMQSNLLSLVYRIKYNKNTGSNNDISAMSAYKYDEQHIIKCDVGFLVMTIVQETLLVLLSSLTLAQTAFASTDKVSGDNVSSASNTTITEPSRKLEHVVKLKSKGCTVLLHQNSRPLVAFTTWNLSLYLHSQLMNRATFELRVMDTMIHHFFDSTNKRIIFHRMAEHIPALLVNSMVNFNEVNQLIVEDMSICTAPMVITLFPVFVNSLLTAVLQGSLFTMYGLVIRSNNTRTPPTTDNSTMFNVFQQFISRCGGKYDVRIGGIEINAHLQNEANSSKPAIFSCGFSQASLRSRWGSKCSFLGAESLLSVKEIQAKVNNLSFIDKFDFFVDLNITPSERHEAASLQQRLQFDILHRPKCYELVSHGAIYLSLSASSIFMHCNELICHDSGLILLEISKTYNLLSTELVRAPSSGESIASTNNFITEGFPFEMNFNLHLYELAIALDTVTFDPLSLHSRISRNNIQSSIENVLLFSVRNFILDLSVQPPRPAAVNDASGVSNSCYVNIRSINLCYNNVVKKSDTTKRIIASISNCEQHCLDQDIPSGANAHEEVIHYSCVRAVLKMTDTYETLVQITLNNLQFIFFMDAIIHFKLICELYYQALYVGLSEPTASEDTSYTSSRTNTPVKGRKWNHNKFPHVSTLLMRINEVDKDSVTMIRNQQQQQRESTTSAHPSSVPLATATSYFGNSSNTVEDSPDYASVPEKVVVLLRNKSLSLPHPFQSLKFIIQSKSCGLWLPSDDDDVASLSLHIGVDVDGEYALHNISHDDASGTLCSATINILPQMYYSVLHYPEVFQPLVRCDDEINRLTDNISARMRKFAVDEIVGKESPIFIDEEFAGSPMPRTSSPSLDSACLDPLDDNESILNIESAKAMSSRKMLLSPLHVKLFYSLQYNDNPLYTGDQATADATEETIRDCNLFLSTFNQTIDCSINEIEIFAGLDYRLLIKISDNILKRMDQLQVTGQAAAAVGRSISRATSVSTEQSSIFIPNSIIEFLSSLPQIAVTNGTLHIPAGGKIHIINDFLSYPIAVARINIGLINANFVNSTDAASASSDYQLFQSRVTASINMEYNNLNLLCWEPLIEPFDWSVGCTIPINSSPANRNLNIVSCVPHHAGYKWDVDELKSPSVLTFFKNCTPILSTAQISHMPSMDVTLDVSNTINMNITIPVLESTLVTVSGVLSAMKENEYRVRKQGDSGSKSNVTSTMFIRNESGLRVSYWFSNPQFAVKVPSQEEIPLVLLEEDVYSFDPMSSFKSVYLHIEYSDSDNEMNSVCHVPLDGKGSRIFVLDDSMNDFRSNEYAHLSSGQQAKRKQLRVLRSPSYKMLRSKNITYIACDIEQRDGSKVLTIRSTIRLVNSISIPMRVQLVQKTDANPSSPGAITNGNAADIIWEMIIPPNSEAPVPANCCSLANSHFNIQPLCNGTVGSYSYHYINRNVQVLPVEMKIPDFPDLPNNSSVAIADAPASIDDNLTLDHYEDVETRNGAVWREMFNNIEQSRGAIDTRSYAKWLSFKGEMHTSLVGPNESTVVTDDQLHCNILVSSVGTKKSPLNVSSSTSHMSRLLTFMPTVTIYNLLACDIEFVLSKVNHSDEVTNNRQNDVITLSPSLSYGSLAFHSVDDISIMLRLQSTNSISRDIEWSQGVKIVGCRSTKSEDLTISVDTISSNGAALTVLLDVIDNNGSREIYVYVPYWIITSSFLSIQYNHDNSYMVNGNTKALNGIDGLAADQIYDRKLNSNLNSKLKKQLPKGVGLARGISGIVLGPELPVRGLSDVLRPKRMNEFGKLLTRKKDELVSITVPTSSGNTNHEGIDDNSIDDNYKINYRLMQCGHTNTNSKRGYLKVRGHGTNWSNKSFSLDDLSISSMEVESTQGYVDPDDFSIWVRTGHHVPPNSRGGTQIFSLGMMVINAEPPFQRTKIAVVVDKYILLNTMDFNIEIKQAR